MSEKLLQSEMVSALEEIRQLFSLMMWCAKAMKLICCSAYILGNTIVTFQML